MKHKSTLYQPIILAMFLFAMNLHGQSTRALFSRPGLELGAYHHNIYDGSRNTSWRYAGDTLLCGDTLVMFDSPTNTTYKTFLKFQGGKVFVQNSNNPCAPGIPYYDFDLLVGQFFSLQQGGPTLPVMQKSQKTLLNGETRRYLKLGGNGWTIEWLEGIGDIGNGLQPAFYDFEGYDRFVCARDNTGQLWENPSEAFLCDSLLCPLPLPKFSATTNEKTATFSNLTANGISWLWEFGDGQSSTEMNPVHTYSGPGCYEVCLTAYTDCLQRPFRLCNPTPVCVDPAWVQSPPPPVVPNTPYDSDLEFLDANTGWALYATSIWKTTDGGQTWNEQFYPLPPAPATRRLQSIQMLDAQTGIIACLHYGGSGSEKSLLVTHNGGQSWEERNGTGSMGPAILTLDGQGFAKSQFSELFYSNDGGDTWTQRDIPGLAEFNWFQYMGGDTLYAIGYQGLPPQHTPAFAKSFDAGLHWQFFPMPGHPVQTEAHFLNTSEGWAVGGTGYLLHTMDAGQSWQPYFFGEMLKVQSIAFANKHVGWAVGEKGLVLHTTHGGFDWQRENCGYLGSMRNLSVPNPGTAFANGNSLDIMKYQPGLLPNCGVSTSELEAPARAPRLLLSPNPVSDILEVSLPEGMSLQATDKLLIVNALGQPFQPQATKGDASIQLAVASLPPGYYALVARRENGVWAVARFVKL